MNARMPHQSYVWDILNPNTPDVELLPPSPLCCLRFNPKNTDSLVGGSYNGLITFYDLRKSGGSAKETVPHSTSIIEKSHHDPVYDVYWINSKTGNQCVSVSTDGQMLWWDTRRLSEPTDSLQLCTDIKSNGQILGGSSLEYNSEAGPSKYLVGTEQGVVLMVNLKNRSVLSHHGDTDMNYLNLYDWHFHFGICIFMWCYKVLSQNSFLCDWHILTSSVTAKNTTLHWPSPSPNNHIPRLDISYEDLNRPCLERRIQSYY